MVRRNEFAPIQLLKTTQDKMSRAQSIQARMRAGGVKFDKDADWYFTFEEELLKFPRDRHDDQVDSFAHLGALVDRMYDHETEEELAQNEYDEMVQKESYTTGRSGTTGY
jgi:phage terminase large subunit-like protein